MRKQMAMVMLAILLGECDARQRAPQNSPAEVMLRWDQPTTDPLVRGNDPPNEITIRWTPTADPDLDVNDLAEQHCRAWDRRAEPVREEISGNTTLTQFVCRPLLNR
jgi:hypothetical protein